MNAKNIFFAGTSNPNSPKFSSYSSSNICECKYCFTEDHIKNLIQPCNCLGSLRFVHEKCLCEWIQKSKKNIELTYENDLAYYCSKCELCNFQMKFHINYENNFLKTIFITLKYLLMSMKNLTYFILHTIVIFYFFNRLDFIISHGIDVFFSQNLNMICLIRFVNEVLIFFTILWYTRDIIKYYMVVFSEERKIIMKFVSNISINNKGHFDFKDSEKKKSHKESYKENEKNFK